MASYGNLCTEFYDLDKPAAPARALAFYLQRAHEAGGRVLEPMCGSGRFLLPMVQAGLAIDGVDASPAMLAACRARAGELGVEVDLHQQDLAALQLPHRYTMAFIPAGSIGLITDDAVLRQVLARIHAHLVPRAALWLEVPGDDDGPAGASAWPLCTVQCPDGRAIRHDCVATRPPGRALIRYRSTYTRLDGPRVVETEHEELELRLHELPALAALLRSCGFGTVQVTAAHELDWLADSGCSLVEARAGA